MSVPGLPSAVVSTSRFVARIWSARISVTPSLGSTGSRVSFGEHALSPAARARAAPTVARRRRRLGTELSWRDATVDILALSLAPRTALDPRAGPERLFIPVVN